MPGRRPEIRARNPLVREAFERMDKLPGTVELHGEAAGVNAWIIGKWRKGVVEPRLCNFIALVTALGGRITIEWKDKP